MRRATREEIVRLRAIADYQFGPGAGECLIPDDAILGISPNTLRIREVYEAQGRLIATLRAHDYMYSLNILGASKLLTCFEKPLLRVIVDREKLLTKSIPAVAVIELDERLRAGDEVIVVDTEDNLIGVGRLRLSPLEIKARVYGEAVRLRKRVTV